MKEMWITEFYLEYFYLNNKAMLPNCTVIFNVDDKLAWLSADTLDP